MSPILGIILGFLMLIAAIIFNPVRRKMAGIIGVGGAYLILIGIVAIAAVISSLFGVGEEVGTTQILAALIIGAVGILYMVYIMFARCQTVGQRIFLPFAACLIGFGFCWRFVFSLILHIPMESGNTEAETAFPSAIQSPDGEVFTLEDDSGDNATYYCSRTGQRAHFRDVDFEDGGCPTGWYRN